jgi:hypothetical protein
MKLPFSKSHAFLIGNNAYRHVAALSTPINDVNRLSWKLEEEHGYIVHSLLDATLEQTRDWIHHYIPSQIKSHQNGEPQDRVLFFFAGHGIALDSDTGPQGFLVPVDAERDREDSLLPMRELSEAISRLPCDHGLLILDCCFAGAFKWAAGFRSLMWRDLPKVVYEERFRKYCLDPAWQVICSSAYDQKAFDVLHNYSLGYRESLRDDSKQAAHSPFALTLFRALDGEADIVPVSGGDGLITTSELYIFLRDQLEGHTLSHEGHRQTPLLFPLPRHDKGEYIFLAPKHRLNLPPTPKRNPFMGLASYNEDDAEIFFGRDGIIEDLLDHVMDRQLTVVTGASGTGKSSLVKAGIIPKLRQDGYHVFPVFRPGKQPVENLRKELPDFEVNLGAGKAIFFIDQYEELLTQTASREIASEFETLLLNSIQSYPQLKIILSIRADFEPQFEKGTLNGQWQAGRYVMPPFSSEELRQIVVRPAIQEVFQYEPDTLVNQIVDEVSQAPGGLPLLSFTLSELYHAYIDSGRTDRLFTLEDYQKLGGVIGSLRTKADKVYRNLSPDQQNTMRRLMLRMVSLEGGETAGKRVYVADVDFKRDPENERVQFVLSKLVEARLIVRARDLQNRPYFEPAHDALVRAWATLWEWIKTTGEERIILQNKLSQAVEDYEQSNAERNMLWNNDPRLGLLEGELKVQDSWMNTREQNFIQASIKRRTALRRRNYGILFGVILALVTLAGVALNQRNVAVLNAENEKIQRKRADSTRLVAIAQRNRADSTTHVAERNLLISNRNLIRAYNNDIKIQKGAKAEEERRARLAAGANLNEEQRSHRERISEINFTIASITRVRDSLQAEVNKADSMLKGSNR